MKLKKNINSINAADKLVLQASKVVISETELQKMNLLLARIENVDAFVVQVIKRGIAGLFFKKIPHLSNKSVLNSQSVYLIEQAFLRTINRSVLLYSHLTNVINALQSADIEVVVLKGAYLAESVYGDIGLRQFSDLDILIRSENSQRAIEVLLSEGYRYEEQIPVSNFIKSKSDIVHLQPMVKNGVSVELHIKLHKASESYQINIDDVFISAKEVTLNGIKCKALDIYHQIVHIAVHAHKHFEEGNINFTSFSDLVNLLLTLPKDFNWQNFNVLCEKYNASKVVFRYLLLVSDFYELNIIPELYINAYNAELNEDFKQKFIDFLKGYKRTEQLKTAIPGHLKNLGLIKNPIHFSKYLFDLFFPPKHFMIAKYDIKNEKLFVFYYPYRYLTILSGLWQMLLLRKQK